jgi:hypothetical protein
MKNRLAVFALIVILAPVFAMAEVPELIHYQGRLLDGTNLVNSSIELSLKLYNQPVGGDLLYEDSNTVTVIDGLYSTTIGDDGIGSLAAVLTNALIFIQVDVNGTPLSPRERMMSVGFALKADGVSTGSITTAMLADGAVTSEKIGSGEVKTVNIESGAVGSNQLAASAVSAEHIADGAVGTDQLAAGSVTAAILAKPYQSGGINLYYHGQTDNIDFSAYLTNITVTFSPAFGSMPIISLGLETGIRTLADQANPYITSKSRSNFTIEVSIPLPFTQLKEQLGGAGGLSLQPVNGRPAVAYQCPTSGVLRFARALNSLGTLWGEPLTVDTNDNRGHNCCLAIINGTPAISYYSYSESDLCYVRSSNLNGTAWAAPVVVDTNGYVGMYTSLAEVNGYPAIAYQDDAGSALALKYVRGSDAAGTSWQTPIRVDTNGYPGRSRSLAVINGNPAIAYYEQMDSMDLLFIRANDQWGDTWPASSVEVYTNGNVGKNCTMTTVSNYAAIAFSDLTDGELNFVRATDLNGTTWGTPRTVFTNSCSYLAMDIIQGNPAIACYNAAAERILYFYADNYLGSIWGDPITVYTNSDDVDFVRLISLTDVPSIAFYDGDVAYSFFTRSGNPPTNSYINWIAIEP